MTDVDRKIVRQMRWLLGVVVILVLLIGVNFWIALAQPNKTIQTIIGPSGPAGALGLKGEKGEKGDKGDQGPPGLSGGVGQNGEPGANGANGLNGNDGRNGLNGADGANGTNGTNGTDGRTPEMACVDGMISWRYTDEVAWRPLYADCEPPAELITE